MGGVLSYLFSWWSTPIASDQNLDPKTGLTARDRELITQTWDLIIDKKSIKQNSVSFFIQLFDAYPYMQDFFHQFKGKPLSEIRVSAKLRAHALGAISLITSYVNNMDDPETLVALIVKMAQAHLSRNISTKEFEDMKIIFVPYLKSILGNEMTPEAANSWLKLLTTHNAVVKQTADTEKDNRS